MYGQFALPLPSDPKKNRTLSSQKSEAVGNICVNFMHPTVSICSVPSRSPSRNFERFHKESSGKAASSYMRKVARVDRREAAGALLARASQ